MSIFALLFFVAAGIVALVEAPRRWVVPALIVTGIVLALVVTTGTQVSVH